MSTPFPEETDASQPPGSFPRRSLARDRWGYWAGGSYGGGQKKGTWKMLKHPIIGKNEETIPWT